MAKGGGGGQREGNALKAALVVTGGLVLAWVTMETAFKPILDRLRAAISRSSDPNHDPDDATTPAPAATEAPATAAEPTAPPLPAEEEKAAEKPVALEEEAAKSE